MNRRGLSAALAAALMIAGSAAYADDLPIPTKAPPVPVAFAAVPSCSSFWDFITTACPLTWYGVTFYGTVDTGINYSTHGTPFDPNHPTGEAYLLGAGGFEADNRKAGFFPGENGLSQSNVGVKSVEPLAPGWNFVSVNELAFNPDSLLLANAPRAEFNAIGVPENQWQVPFDSSRWAWLAASNFVGVSSPTWGTLTFGRQNTPLNDAIVAYDPMGASYAFSVIGYSGKTAGAGDTEDARWTTAIKYRVEVPITFGSVRAVAMGQPIGGSTGGYDAYNANNGAASGGLGATVKGIGPGVLSMDFFGTWERDAINWQAVNPASVNFSPETGWPINFDPNTFIKATISNNTSFMAVAKYSFGSWANTPAPVVSKAPGPSGPSGIPLTLYGGYEWIKFTNPSDPQSAFSSFHDDGFLFMTNPAAVGCGGTTPATANGTCATTNAFNLHCQSGNGCTDQIFQVIWTGARYSITKDLDIAGAYYHYIQSDFVINSGTTPGKVNCTLYPDGNSRCAGWFDAYSVVLDWRFLPKWDVYIGTMYSAAFGGLAFGDITRNDLSTTAGVRFRF